MSGPVVMMLQMEQGLVFMLINSLPYGMESVIDIKKSNVKLQWIQ